MHLLLFEPQLSSFAGHYNRYARVIAGEVARQGLRLSIVSNHRIEPRLRSTLEGMGVEVIPAFEDAPYRMHTDIDERSDVSRMLSRVALECLATRPSARAAWLSGTGALLGGACMFASEAKVPFVFQMLDFAPDWPTGQLAAPRDLRDAAAQAVASGMRLHAQSALVASHFEREIGFPVALFPAILDRKPARQRKPPERPVVGIMNMLRNAKDPWPAVEAMIAHGDRLSIVLHLGQETTTEVVEPTVQKVKSLVQRYGLKAAEVKIIPGTIPADRYNAEWQDLDCCIMPYDVETYTRQGSGMLFESLADGIIPIAPLGTSMAEIMQRAKVGITYAPHGTPNEFHAIARLLQDFDALAQRSRDYAPVYLEANSPGEVVRKLLV